MKFAGGYQGSALQRLSRGRGRWASKPSRFLSLAARPHVLLADFQELFMAHSQKYARETVLSRRIRDWEEMMGPQLEDQASSGMGRAGRCGQHTAFSA